MEEDRNDSSKMLAELIHSNLYSILSDTYPDTTSRGTRKAPFVVLIGAQMPTVLIETSFITNPIDCQRLMTNKYREEISNGIVAGLKEYITSKKQNNKNT